MQPRDALKKRFSASAKASVIILGCLVTASSARAQVPTLDDFVLTPSGVPNTLAVQQDGRILVGGQFSRPTGTNTHMGLIRAFPNGKVDEAFAANVSFSYIPYPGAVVVAIAFGVQGDGKILLAGSFNALDGQTCNFIGRLNSDGTRDNSFNASASGGLACCLAFQPDGNILVGGNFNMLNGRPCNCIGRLNPNGDLDSSFNSSVLGQGITSMALQPDGKVVILGTFTNILGQSRTNIGRLNADGSLDAGFNPHLNFGGASQAPVYAVALQADDKILVGGVRVQRLNPDGTADTNFNGNVSAYWSFGYGFGLQADGKIITSTIGSFSPGRLNADGTGDIAFHPGFFLGEPHFSVFGMALQVDGKLLIAGTLFGGVRRVNSSDPATQNLNFDGSTITWERGGTSPEVWRTTFESSLDGTNWVMLGAGARIAGGWKLAGVSVPTNSRLRSRGYVTGGYANASSWIVESQWPKAQPSILVDGTKASGGTNGFNLKVIGTPGEIVVIDGSADLSSWTPMVTNTLCSAPAYFSDWPITNFPSRFYRCRLQ